MSPVHISFARAHRPWVALLFVITLLPFAAAQAQGGGAPPVGVARPLAREVTDWDEFTGRFEAVERIVVQAQVSGFLDSVHFDDGQLVRKGDLLFVIDPRPYQAVVDRARAELARAESQLVLAELDLARAQRLLASNAIAREEVDSRNATRNGAAADVEAAHAALRTAQLNLEFTRVTSPIDGRVSRALVDVGNLVVGGAGAATSLTTVVSIDPIHFVFDASEADYLRYVRSGARSPSEVAPEDRRPVYVRLVDETEWTRRGIIDFVDNVFEQATGTIRVRARFANPDGLLVPGIFGRLRVAATEPYPALLVPDDAVVSDQSAKLLMVVGEDDVVQPRVVRLGPLYEGLRVIRSGIGADDRVIVDGLLRARPGGKVTPQEKTLGQ